VPSPPVKEERAAQAPPELGTAPVPQGHPDGKAVVLCYHQLVTRKPLFNSELNIDDFRIQMKYLADNGYTTLSLAELKNCLAHRSFPPKSVVITFDDGYKTFYTLAYPILKEYGLKAAVFFTTARAPVTSATKADAVPRYLVQSGSLEEFKAILVSASCTNQ
jgi:hypothetical protein